MNCNECSAIINITTHSSYSLGDLLIYARGRRGETYIGKPGCGSQGRGIIITKNVNELDSSQSSICQIYIPRVRTLIYIGLPTTLHSNFTLYNFFSLC